MTYNMNSSRKYKDRRMAIHSVLPDWTAKALTSPAIREPAVSFALLGTLQEKAQAIELYELAAGGNCYPLTAVDLVANTYIRLSYQNSQGSSATLGTSVIGSTSFRTEDGYLHFIPDIEAVLMEIDFDQRPKITIRGNFGKLAKISSVRKYLKPEISMTKCHVTTTFEALCDIRLAAQALGNDAFRFCTISSMYTPVCYDGNRIEYHSGNQSITNFMLTETFKRGTYIFKNRIELHGSLALSKDSFSKGKKNNPGSYDSPSINIAIDENRLELGAQAFLADTEDVNSDSLSAWIEWIDAPNILKAGSVISLSYTITATPPKILQQDEAGSTLQK